MISNCDLITVRQKEDGRFVLKCLACGREYTSKSGDTKEYRANCRNARHVAPPADIAAEGPGTELKSLIDELGLAQFGCSTCESLAHDMNRWGPAECRVRRAEIVADIRSRATKVGWWDKSKAAIQLIREPWFDFIDPIGSMVDEAIRRSESTPNSDS